MRTVPFRFAGQTFHLLLNGAALFDLYEQFGFEGSVTDHIRGNGKETFENVCFFLAKLAEQGELLRRYQGRDRGPIPTAETFRVGLSPLEVPRAKAAIQAAIASGFSREEAEEPKEVDLGLLEIEKKTDAG